MAHTAPSANPLLIAAAALTLALPGQFRAAAAQDPASGTSDLDVVAGPNGERVYKIDGPTQSTGAVNFKLIAGSTTEGKLVNAVQDFEITRLPATFAARLDSGELCTATLIGPKVILTAAHCVDQKFEVDGRWQTVTGSVAKSDGRGTKLIRICDMAAAYTATPPKSGEVRNENDFALCELVAAFNVTAENLSLGATQVAANQKLMLAGFGCTNTDLTNKVITSRTPNQGVLNVGFNKVQGTSGTWLSLEGRVDGPDAILCPGDSGGAAYVGVDLSRANDRGWKIVAVNSAVGPGAAAPNASYMSYLAPLSDPDFRAFLDGWVRIRPNSRKICGVHLNSLNSNCRR